MLHCLLRGYFEPKYKRNIPMSTPIRSMILRLVQTPKLQTYKSHIQSKSTIYLFEKIKIAEFV